MRRILVLTMVTATLGIVPLAAQDSTPKPPDSTHVDSVPVPPPPTPEQTKWMQGLRTAARGIGQIKSGIERVQRAHSPTDLHSAGKLLAGWCGTGRGFMRSGIAKMPSSAYPAPDDRKIARQVVIQIDSVIKESTSCESAAMKDPKAAVDRLTAILVGYEGAIAAWRAMVGLPALPPTRPTKP